MAWENTSTAIRPYSVQSRESRFKRARTFFKHLGLKRSSKATNTSSSSILITDPYEDPLDDEFMPEMHSTCRGPAELANSNHRPRSDWGTSWGNNEILHEMDTPRVPDLQPPYSTGMDLDMSAGPCELGTGISHETLQCYKAPATSEYSPNGVGAQFNPRGLEQMCGKDDQVLGYPLSAVHGLPQCDTTANGSPLNLVSSTSIMGGPFEAMQSPEVTHGFHIEDTLIRNRTATNNPLPSHLNGDFSVNGSLSSTLSHVEGLREVVRALNIEWVERLTSTPNLVMPCSAYYEPSLFDTGVQAIQNCFRDKLPTTLAEIIALMHVTCGAAYILHCNDETYRWGDFFRDMSQWRHAMQTETNVRLLDTFVNLLWPPEAFSTSLSGNGIDDQAFAAPLAAGIPSFHASVPPFQTMDGFQYLGSQPPHHLVHDMQLRGLWAMLKKGLIIKEFSNFLSGKPSIGNSHEITFLT